MALSHLRVRVHEYEGTGVPGAGGLVRTGRAAPENETLRRHMAVGDEQVDT